MQHGRIFNLQQATRAVQELLDVSSNDTGFWKFALSVFDELVYSDNELQEQSSYATHEKRL